MDGCAFYEQVSEHEELVWLGVRKGPDVALDEVYVAYRPTRTKFALPVETILSRDWEELEAVLTGKRRPRVLTHLTRIVGYFSQVHNWNRSKHAELADRHGGTYVLPETRASRSSAGPQARQHRAQSPKEQAAPAA